ncbi:MAG: hypothetical protein JNL11_16370 [Bdellovibrionaceae bacterium]|nr:hypothetical protein [Pseudobdellovibrionaceae bacterium]
MNNLCLSYYTLFKNSESLVEYQFVSDDLTSESVIVRKKISDIARQVTQIAGKRTPGLDRHEAEEKISNALVQFVNLTTSEFQRIDRTYGTSLAKRLTYYFDESSASFYFNIFKISQGLSFLNYRNEERMSPGGVSYDVRIPDSFEMPRFENIKFGFKLQMEIVESMLKQRNKWKPKGTPVTTGVAYKFSDVDELQLHIQNPNDTVVVYRGSYTVQNEKELFKRIAEGHRAWGSFNKVGEKLLSLSADNYLEKMIEELIKRKGTSNEISGASSFYVGFSEALGTAQTFVRNTANYYEFEIPREVLIKSDNLVSYTINSESEVLTLFGTHPSWLKRVVKDGVEIYSRQE